jgi:hypothetical protein
MPVQPLLESRIAEWPRSFGPHAIVGGNHHAGVVDAELARLLALLVASPC